MQPIHFSLIQPSHLLVELYSLLETEPPLLRTAVPVWAWGQRLVHGPLLFRGINIATRAVCCGGYEHAVSSALLFQGGRKKESPIPPGSTDRGPVSSFRKNNSSSDLFKKGVTCVPPSATLVSAHHTPMPPKVMGASSWCRRWWEGRAVVPHEHQPNTMVILCTSGEKSRFLT